MKFKPCEDDEDLKSIKIADGMGDELTLQTRADGKPGLYIRTTADGVILSRKKVLKMAWAIIFELQDGLTR